jgi:hypothetical protein
VNGKGYYADCPLFPGTGGGAAPPTCTPKDFTVPPGRSAQQPWASANNPGVCVWCWVHVCGKRRGVVWSLRVGRSLDGVIGVVIV